MLDGDAVAARFAPRFADARLDLHALFSRATRVVAPARVHDLVIDDAANVVVDGDLDVDGVLERRGDAGSLICSAICAPVTS